MFKSGMLLPDGNADRGDLQIGAKYRPIIMEKAWIAESYTSPFFFLVRLAKQKNCIYGMNGHFATCCLSATVILSQSNKYNKRLYSEATYLNHNPYSCTRGLFTMTLSHRSIE